MSKVAVQGNASGTGTLTIAAPNTNTDRTLTLPDEAGTVLTTATPGVPVNGPAFSAYASSGVTMTSSYTRYKITLNNTLFDTNSDFDAVNHRFMPSVAGYYIITGSAATTGTAVTRSHIYKNGSAAVSGAVQSTTGFGGAASTASCVIYCNGTSDYVELYIESQTAGQTSGTSSTSVYLTGALVRAA